MDADTCPICRRPFAECRAEGGRAYPDGTVACERRGRHLAEDERDRHRDAWQACRAALARVRFEPAPSEPGVDHARGSHAEYCQAWTRRIVHTPATVCTCGLDAIAAEAAAALALDPAREEAPRCVT